MAKRSYYRRPDGLYETTRTVNGKRVRFRGRTCAEVDRKILEYNTQVKQGRKLEVIGREWLEGREREVAYSTYITYDRYLKVLLKWLGNRYASEVRPLDISRYVADVEAKGYKRDTVDAHLTVAKQVFSHAVRMGDIDTNPAREVFPSRKPVKGSRRALTEDEERLVEDYRGKDWLLGVMLLYTGLRRGELLALTWQDIDLKAGTISVTKKINYTISDRGVLEHQLKSTNGNKPRPILAPLAAALPKTRRRIGYVFADENGGYMSEYGFAKRFKAYRKAVGLPDDITPHCFRHSYATICFDAGIDAKDAAAFLGDTEEVVRNIYMELRDSRRVSSAEQVSAYLQMRAEKRERRA